MAAATPIKISPVDGMEPKQENVSKEGSSAQERLHARQQRRLQDRQAWDAYWKIQEIETAGTYVTRMRYKIYHFIDNQVSWVREKLIEPLHDKYRMPYYHRKISRVPEIDMCGVNDHTCVFEANEQYRLDKLVDYFILQILKSRLDQCMFYYRDAPTRHYCVPLVHEMEQADLNFFIKYGELGSEGDVRDAYMKQKHRMVWERRHPEIMAERERKYKEYLEKMKEGNFDYSFWKKGLWFQDKKQMEAPYTGAVPSKPTIEGDRPLSKDWDYYKKVAQDPEFDKEQGQTSRVPLMGHGSWTWSS